VARERAPARPGELVFRINATIFDRHDIGGVALETRTQHEVPVRTLALDVRGEHGHAIRKEIPLDDEWAAEADRAVRLLNRRVAAAH
jgi:hypothetical protein